MKNNKSIAYIFATMDGISFSSGLVIFNEMKLKHLGSGYNIKTGKTGERR